MQEIDNAKQEGHAQSVVQHIGSHITKSPPLLVVLCGPSHAGKTTLARRLAELGGNFAIISPDAIRRRLGVRFGEPEHEAMIWDIYESAKSEALKQGRNVILNACHISEQARWHALQGPNEHHRKICVVFDMPWRTVREQCLRARRMALDEVKRMWEAFQRSKPTPGELKRQGFDEVHFIRRCAARRGWVGWHGNNAKLLVEGDAL